MTLNNSQKGLLLVEIVMAITVLSIVAIGAISIFSYSLETNAHQKEAVKLRYILQKKVEEIKTIGFWVWTVDTDAPVYPGNASDPAVEWGTYLDSQGLSTQGKISKTFYITNPDFSITAFANPEFDQHHARQLVEVKVELQTSRGGFFSESFMLSSFASEDKLNAQLFILKKGLKTYFNEMGSYPSSNLSALVPNYLVEIPNDPYTTTLNKTTHVEESLDWNYQNTSTPNMISIYAYSHPNLVSTWNY